MRDLSDTEIARLQALLDEVARLAPALDPLDASALDGFLCGVLLQPQAVPEERWWPFVADAEGRAAPAACAAPLAALAPLVRRRHAALGEAIAARRWFDPWIFELEGTASPTESVLPWVGGFALAAERFPALLRGDETALAEPMALLYQHLAPEHLEGLEDEPALAAALEALEPPEDLAEAAKDLVQAVLLLADIGRPLTLTPPPAPPGRTAPARAGPGPGPRSRIARPARARRG
jgi:uncharacterized protein